MSHGKVKDRAQLSEDDRHWFSVFARFMLRLEFRQLVELVTSSDTTLRRITGFDRLAYVPSAKKMLGSGGRVQMADGLMSTKKQNPVGWVGEARGEPLNLSHTNCSASSFAMSIDFSDSSMVLPEPRSFWRSTASSPLLLRYRNCESLN